MTDTYYVVAYYEEKFQGWPIIRVSAAGEVIVAIAGSTDQAFELQRALNDILAQACGKV